MHDIPVNLTKKKIQLHVIMWMNFDIILSHKKASMRPLMRYILKSNSQKRKLLMVARVVSPPFSGKRGLC